MPHGSEGSHHRTKRTTTVHGNHGHRKAAAASVATPSDPKDHNIARQTSQENVDDAQQQSWKLKRLRRAATPISTVICLVICSIVFGTFGGFMFYWNSLVEECITEYADPIRACANIVDCTNAFLVQIDVKDCIGVKNNTLQGPVYLFYQLENYYQNIRQYWRSRSNQQLMGHITRDPTELVSCYPSIMGRNNRILYPCGALARSVFNDTFQVLVPEVELDESTETITWFADRDQVMYRNAKPEDIDPDYIDDWIPEAIFPGKVENPHFVNWMRTATLPTFRKLYGVIQTSVELPMLVLVQSRYPVKPFNGRKSIVLTTRGWLGARNYFLSLAYIVTAALSLLFALCFFF